MNTPDTELHMKALAKAECAKNAGELTVVRLGYVVSLMEEVRDERDTYWKERVEEAVKAERERILKACDVNSFLRDEDHEDFVVYLTDIETITKATPITNEDKTNGL